MGAEVVSAASDPLEPYLPRMAVSWLADDPDRRWRGVEGSLAFVDISGFTALTEALARQGKVGAEQLSDILSATFAELLTVAYADGAQLVKWGGDAVLLLFDGADHAARAARATYRMRERLSVVGRIRAGRTTVTLRMSVGIHSGEFHFFLVGDPEVHRELVISGPAASRCAETEALAEADQIGLTAETVAVLDPSYVGGPLGEGALLAACPDLPDLPPVRRPDPRGLDLGSLLPPPIRDHLRSARGEAEHRTIAVGFVQFGGTDALLAHEGPDALAEALDECVRSVQRAARRYGVTFFETDINRDGGKVMLTAGAPASADRNEERMLLAAAEIVSRPGRLTVRVGVNRGEVFSGDFGPEFRRTSSVKGDAINLAARLLGKAQPGQAVVTLRTLERSATAFEHEPIEPFLVKGKSEPVHAAVLGAPTVPDEPLQRRASLVGRESELAVLDDAVAGLLHGSGSLLDVVGGPGVGKSRLLEALVERTDVPVTRMHGDEYESATPYWPFRAWLRALGGIGLEADDASVLADLDALVRHRDPALLPWLPLVADVLAVEAPPTPEIAALSPDFRKTRLETAVARFVAVIADGPHVLVVDDAHHLDDVSADLLAAIAGRPGAPAWLVAVARRESTRGFHPASTARRVDVGPLSDVDARALLEAELADSAVTRHDLDLMVRRAAGNPLFLHVLAGAARSGARVDTLPETVEAVVTAQIDQLPPDERTVLRVASVLGISFHESELRELLRDRPLPTGPDSLERLGRFLRPLGAGRFGFAQQLLRDTAYEGLPYRLRREMHARAGDLLERTAPDLSDVSALLSLHFQMAGDGEKAWRYSCMAGDVAVGVNAHLEAAELFARALDVARSLRGIDPQARARVVVALGDAYAALGRNDDAVATYVRARRLLSGDAAHAAAVLRREASTYRNLGRYDRAARAARDGIARLGGASDPASLRTRSELEVALAGVGLLRGRFVEGLDWAHRAVEHAEASGDRQAQADAYGTLFSLKVSLGTPDREPGEKALQLYGEAGDRAQEAKSLGNLAFLSWTEGHGAEALETFRRAERLAAESGDTYAEGAMAANVGDMLVLLGHADEAVQVLRRCIPGLRAAGLDSYLAVARRSLAMAYVGQGRADAGLALLDDVAVAQRALDEPDEAVITEACRAVALLALGAPAAADGVCRRALHECASLDAEQAVTQLLRVQGAALSDLGRYDEAADVLTRALAGADAEAPFERGFVRAELARLAERRGLHDEARTMSARADEAFRVMGFIGNERYARG